MKKIQNKGFASVDIVCAEKDGGSGFTLETSITNKEGVRHVLPTDSEAEFMETLVATGVDTDVVLAYGTAQLIYGEAVDSLEEKMEVLEIMAKKRQKGTL